MLSAAISPWQTLRERIAEQPVCCVSRPRISRFRAICNSPMGGGRPFGAQHFTPLVLAARAFLGLDAPLADLAALEGGDFWGTVAAVREANRRQHRQAARRRRAARQQQPPLELPRAAPITLERVPLLREELGW
jgi:hypothetical protein